MIMRFLLLYLRIAALFSGVGAQRLMVPRGRYVVDPKRPAVYVLQVAAPSRLGTSVDEGSPVFFRLYNNLKWPIRLTVSSAGKNEGDVQLDYALLDSNDKHLRGHGCHVCTDIALSPGKNLLFSLPRSEVASSARIRVDYSYWWEDSGDVGTEKEPFHYILFTFERK